MKSNLAAGFDGMVRQEISDYIYNDIVPRYDGFDSAHKRDHVLTVISQAGCLYASAPDEVRDSVDPEILFVAAACHDLGLVNGREHHHTDSGIIIRNDLCLCKWLSEGQIELAAQAAEDHRASGKSDPRTIYGKLVAEADRVIEPDTIIIRTLQFGLDRYPELDMDGHVERAMGHLSEKYGRGGYLRLWIPWSDNAVRLSMLQDLIGSPDSLRRKTEDLFRKLI